MLKKGFAKRAVLAVWMLASAVSLGGCMTHVSERAMTDLSSREIAPSAPAPQQDGAVSREESVTLYFLDEDGAALRPVTRQVSVPGGGSRAQAALEALLSGPQEDERGVSWPDLGASRSGRMLEVSGGVATVDLPAHTRTLAQQTMYAVRLAIANTLTEFSEISYVNVLVGGREEGLDLGATLPVGTLAHTDDLQVGARYSRLYEQRLSGEGVTLLSTLYFPSEDGRLILPQVRSVAYAQISPIEYLYTLLGEMGKGAGSSLCAQEVPAPLEYIEEMPEIVRTQEGYLAIELCFDRELEEDLARGGMTLGVYMAMLTDTLMGFVPGVEGLKVSLGEENIVFLSQERTPDGREIEFEHGLATREDFAGYVGAPATLYVMHEGGLARRQYVTEQSLGGNMRARLEALLAHREDSALPEGLEPQDILSVHVGEEVISVNLSGAFREALAALDGKQERAAAYAMVNTLTEGMKAEKVEFFFEDKQVSALAGGLEMRGSFLRNPGMVVN